MNREPSLAPAMSPMFLKIRPTPFSQHYPHFPRHSQETASTTDQAGTWCLDVRHFLQELLRDGKCRTESTDMLPCQDLDFPRIALCCCTKFRRQGVAATPGRAPGFNTIWQWHQVGQGTGMAQPGKSLHCSLLGCCCECPRGLALLRPVHSERWPKCSVA